MSTNAGNRLLFEGCRVHPVMAIAFKKPFNPDTQTLVILTCPVRTTTKFLARDEKRFMFWFTQALQGRTGKASTPRQ